MTDLSDAISRVSALTDDAMIWAIREDDIRTLLAAARTALATSQKVRLDGSSHKPPRFPNGSTGE